MDVFLSLTLSGISTGMLLFLMASGLSLIFGLMGIMNFAHGAVFMYGAYTGAWVYGVSGSFILALVAALLVGAILGLVVEVSTIRKVYGNPLGQVLITMGIMIILECLLKVIWGTETIGSPLPPLLSGYWEVSGVTIQKYQIFVIALGLLILWGMHLILSRSRLGMIVRAGVQNPEMVQALGIDIKRVFMAVFIMGTTLATLGGFLMGPNNGLVHPALSIQYMMLGFIVVVIGGLGSFTGSMIGALIVGLASNYIPMVWPDGAMAVTVLVMAAILMIKPSGLLGTRRDA